MSDEAKWANDRTADPLCACVLERRLNEQTIQPPFVVEPLKQVIRKAYAALYTEDGKCVRHGEIRHE